MWCLTSTKCDVLHLQYYKNLNDPVWGKAQVKLENNTNSMRVRNKNPNKFALDSRKRCRVQHPVLFRCVLGTKSKCGKSFLGVQHLLWKDAHLKNIESVNIISIMAHPYYILFLYNFPTIINKNFHHRE